jgi:hypothetical protein
MTDAGEQAEQRTGRARALVPVLLLLLAVLAAAGTVAYVATRGDDDRFYSAGSPFNTNISDDARVDPRSDEMIDTLVAEVDEHGWAIATSAWTNTVYEADDGAPRHAVELTSSAYAGQRLLDVPIPDGARVPEDSDGGLVVIDRENECEYDLSRAEKRDGGGWSAWFANALPLDGEGVYPRSEAPSASGFASAAGMIMPEELEAGEIDHALAFTMKNTKAGGPVRPATGSDGRSTEPGAIPEGARLQLDPELDLDALGLQPHERTIAEALQRYGMFLVDTGGAVALRVEHTLSTGYEYPWGRRDGRLPTELARHLRVLETGPQHPVRYDFVPNRCATIG